MPHTKLHDAIADAFALVETAVERKIDGRSARIVTLLKEPSERIEGVWRSCFKAAEKAGGPLSEDDWDTDMDDLVDWPRDARDFRWASIIQTSMAAAEAQYDAENILPDLWNALEKGGLSMMREAAVVPRPLSPEAKRGPNRAAFAAAKERVNASKT